MKQRKKCWMVRSMISCITVENFRGFKSFTAPLTRFTLFGGKNNSGKTSLLEAFFFNYCHLDPNCFFKMNYLRHMNDQPLFTAERLWEPLFNDFDARNNLKITQTSHTENIPYALINQLELNVESHSRTLLCTQTTHPKSGQIVQESFQERFDQQDF